MTVEEISVLFQYDEWATGRTLESVSSLSEESYQRDLKSSHGGVHGTLVHIYGADLIWLERWKGKPTFGLISVEHVPTLDVLKGMWKRYRDELSEYVNGLDAGMLSAPLSYSDSRGNRHAEPLYRQMQHRVNHSSYHRGQVVTMVRQLGEKPQNTDLIAFYRASGK